MYGIAIWRLTINTADVNSQFIEEHRIHVSKSNVQTKTAVVAYVT